MISPVVPFDKAASVDPDEEREVDASLSIITVFTHKLLTMEPLNATTAQLSHPPDEYTSSVDTSHSKEHDHSPK